MNRGFAFGSGIAVTIACQQAPTPATLRESAPKHAANSATSGASRVAEVTPAISAKAEEILRANPQASIGTEFPFELAGHKYVARVEQHDNPDGDPNRPQGPHKGITVYNAE